MGETSKVRDSVAFCDPKIRVEDEIIEEWRKRWRSRYYKTCEKVYRPMCTKRTGQQKNHIRVEKI